MSGKERENEFGRSPDKLPDTFLDAQKLGSEYQETNSKGVIVTHKPVDTRGDLFIWIRKMDYHLAVDATSGTVHPVITGTTSQKFRAIGAANAYEADVRISSETKQGVAIIRICYAKDGQAVFPSIFIGLSDDAISSLRNMLNESDCELLLGGVGGLTIYDRDPVVLSYWQENVVNDKDSYRQYWPTYGEWDIVAEWRCTFRTATLSPDYHGPFGSVLRPHSRRVREVSIVSNVGVQVGEHHPLEPAIRQLAERMPGRGLGAVIVILIVLLVLLLLRLHLF